MVELSDIFRGTNLVAAAMMIFGGILRFFSSDMSTLSKIIIGVYCIIFGLGTALLEFQAPPPYLSRYASFLFSFLGRGIFYIFVGSILLEPTDWKGYIAGPIVGLVGIVYVVCEFLPQIEPPLNMREAEGQWGAEQI